MKHPHRVLPIVLVVGIVVSFGSPAARAAGPRPNVVVVLVDDMGYSDLGCYGGEIATPNLDRLAAGGLRFTQFYNTAKCSPTRAALLTGLYHPEVGVGALRDCMTLGEAMRRAGYFTIMTGKWHLGSQPVDRGFDRYFGHLSGATNFFTGDKTFRLGGEPFQVPTTGFYTTDAMTDYAVRFLDEAADQTRPFLLYVAYNAPHYPLQAPKEEVEKYRGKYLVGWDELRRQRHRRQLEMGLLDGKWKLSPRPADVPAWDSLSEEERRKEDLRMATFAGMVDRADQNVGKLLTKLDEMGATKNTLIMFLSDNGACPFERSKRTHLPPWDPASYWTYDKSWAHACNTPFRWYKQNQHEGGISTPLIVNWPAGLKVKPGSITHQPGHLIDVMATCLDVAGSDYPPTFDGRALKPLRGKSLAPIFRGEKREGHRVLYFQFSNNRAVRRGKWKLVSARGGPWEVYDLDADRTELNDLAAAEPQLAAEMADLWNRWAAEVGLGTRRRADDGKDAGRATRRKRKRRPSPAQTDRKRLSPAEMTDLSEKNRQVDAAGRLCLGISGPCAAKKSDPFASAAAAGPVAIGPRAKELSPGEREKSQHIPEKQPKKDRNSTTTGGFPPQSASHGS
ncbi:MAG: arylsulfatase [Planctomycetota bacterium]|jgi:arylsulfatase